MRIINARALAPQVNHWLATSRQPRVLHIFDHACNVINERREILSVVTPHIGEGPFNLVVDEYLFSNDLGVESLVSIVDGSLLLGGLRIHVTNAKLWHPRPDWESLHARKNDILRLLTQLHISSDLKTSFTAYLSRAADLHHSVLPIPQSLVSSLSSALATADSASARKIASRLAGTGIGLTPSGDDFLMGAIYASWIIHPAEAVHAFARDIASTAASLTTSLSAEWLRSAGRGEVGIRWHEFFESLLSGDPLHIRVAMENILQIGETSGADAFRGFYNTLMTWGELPQQESK
ncbi:MAG TPA: DUF2877 domain-containing protein [Anaerolineales bacterium]|nr:DUF2877 domain-containing protein [Anaerolineales bacterium]